MDKKTPKLCGDLPQHSHDPFASENQICKTNIKIKKTAKKSSDPPSKIIRKAVVECEPMSQKTKIYRVRKNQTYKEPTNLNDIEIPENVRYLEGELFVLSEKEFLDNKIILLGTISCLKILGQSRCWIMDGTFFVVPTMFRQLFTIHGQFKTQIIPLLFCFMSKKNNATKSCSLNYTDLQSKMILL